MNRRIYQVCLNYLQRWPLWLAAIAYLGSCGIALHYAWFQTNVRASNVFPEPPQPGQMVNLMPPMSLDDVSRDTQSIFWNANKLLPINTTGVQPFPNLVSLQIVGELKSADELQVLRSTPNLEAFALLDELPVEGLQYIAELPHLRYLRLLEFPRDLDPQKWTGLPQIETLDLLRIPVYPRALEAISKLPNLKTLTLEVPFVASFKFTDWEQLRSLPRLQTVYLRGINHSPDARRLAIDFVQEALPHVKVRPAVVDELRTNIWCHIVLAGVLVWGVICAQLQSQFSHAGSCVIPHYGHSHLAVAVALWVVTTLLQVIILCIGNCPLIPSLAASLFVPALFWALIAVMLRSNNPQKRAGTLHPFFLAAMCFQVFPVMFVVSRLFLSDVDWFLQGRQPLLACVIVLAGLAAPWFVLPRFLRLHSLYEECPAGVPPLGTNFKAWTVWGKKLAGADDNAWKTWWRGNQSVRLDATLTASTPRDWSRLWSAGNAVDGPRICVRLLIMWATISLMFQALSWLNLYQLNTPVQMLPMAVYLGWTWIEMISLGIVMVWRSRRPMFGYELLRPLTRQQFTQQLFAAIRGDLQPLLLCHLVAMVYMLWSFGFSRLPTLFIPTVVCYALFRALIIYAANLYFLAVRRGWLAIAGIFVVWVLDFMAGHYLVFAAIRPDAWYPIAAISLYLAGVILILPCLVWIKRYWQKIELA